MSKLSGALRVAVRCAVALAAVSTLGVAVAQQAAVNVNIEAQSVDAALRELSRQTNTNILFSPAAVQGLKSTSINALMTAEQAAKALTAGTELEVVRDLTGALIVRRRPISRSSFNELSPDDFEVDLDDELEEVIVVGLRRALETAQQIKRDADTFVDSVTATDIGSFPDKSVAEALQRVAGVTVSRLQSNDDSTHFSAEPAGVLIRGLTFVRTEFNGRDSFSADGYRGLNFNDISPELMSGVDVYKNQTADMIEGGIAGTINLRTRKPLDHEGFTAGLTGSVNFGDFSEETKPQASLLVSNTWDTDIGTFGALIDVAYSELSTRTDSIQFGRPFRRNAAEVGATGVPCENMATGADMSCVFVPAGARWSELDFDRKRKGFDVALQWQPNERTDIWSTSSSPTTR